MNIKIDETTAKELKQLSEHTGKKIPELIQIYVHEDYLKTDLASIYLAKKVEDIKKQIAAGMYSEEVIQSFESVLGIKLR